MFERILIALVALILTGIILVIIGVPYAWAIALVVGIIVFLGSSGYSTRWRH